MSEATANRESEPGFEASDQPAADHSPGDVPEWDSPAPGPPDPTAVESVVNALLEAGPDVAEHVVRAAQELLLAAQTVVDAAQRAVEEQQALRRPPETRVAADDAALRGDDTPGPDGSDPVAAATDDASDDASAPTATVHHLDVGE